MEGWFILYEPFFFFMGIVVNTDG